MLVVAIQSYSGNSGIVSFGHADEVIARKAQGKTTR